MITTKTLNSIPWMQKSMGKFMITNLIWRFQTMIDNPLPDQVMREMDTDFENRQFEEYAHKEAEELCSEHGVWDQFRESFKKWYHDYLSDPKNQDPNDMIDKKNLIEDWWEQLGDDLTEAEWGGWSANPGPYEIDPTPQYLYDDTGGEPPISAEERNRMALESKRESHGRGGIFGFRYH